MNCPHWGKCTSSKNGRRIKVIQKKPFRDKYAKRLESPQFEDFIKERKDQIEHVFGTLKRWMGKVPLLLTTKKKVQVEMDLYSTAYNIRRLLNIENMPLLLERIAAYADIIKKNPIEASNILFLSIKGKKAWNTLLFFVI